jgi:IS5 family transposase
VLRTVRPQQSLWDAILPEQALRLPPGLAELDRYLDDPRFFELFRPYFHPRAGRPSVPMETYLRMMVLKYRYGLGFERLCAEVSDSVSWRRFCRVPLDEAVPHPSTLEKLAARCGQGAVDGLNEALLAKAAEGHLVKLDKVRADTTVVPANVTYPSDAGLLGKGVSRLVVLGSRLKAMGLATRTKARDRRRSMNRRAHSISAWLRRRTDEAKDEVLAITAEMAKIAEVALAEAAKVAANSARGLRRQGKAAAPRARATLAELKEVAATLEKVLSQTRERLGGRMPDGASRVVSFHDKDARPIRKGRIGVPVEFGYKAQVVDNSDGLVLDYLVMQGNPADAPLLRPAIERIGARFAKLPRAVTADRGYGEVATEQELCALGMTRVVIPRRGRPSAARRKVESARGFRSFVKWRTGCEGRIASLKRGYGWARTLMDGAAGAATWCAWGVFAHNGMKLAGLVEAAAKPPPPPARRRATPGPMGGTPPGSGPPGPLLAA